MLRHASTHAAGVVISKNPVDEYVPLYKHQECYNYSIYNDYIRRIRSFKNGLLRT